MSPRIPASEWSLISIIFGVVTIAVEQRVTALSVVASVIILLASFLWLSSKIQWKKQ